MNYDQISIGDMYISGDIIKVHESAPDPIKWVLVEISPNVVQLLRADNFSFGTDMKPVPVKDPHNITEEEFNKIWPHHWNVTQWSAKEFNIVITTDGRKT